MQNSKLLSEIKTKYHSVRLVGTQRLYWCDCGQEFVIKERLSKILGIKRNIPKSHRSVMVENRWPNQNYKIINRHSRT